MTRGNRAFIDGQFDLFLPYISDVPLRDQREVMERPFFSLAKSKRLKPIDYRSPTASCGSMSRPIRITAWPRSGMRTSSSIAPA